MDYTPLNRHEQYLNAIRTGDTTNLPQPINREETYLYDIAMNGGGGGGGATDAVKYTEQSLTAEQQAQARTNIGAAAASDIPSVIDYSTTEQDTGIKWVDGKSVYQKTYVFDPPVAGGGYSYVSVADVSGLSIDTLISISGVQHDQDGNYIMSLEAYSNVGDNMYLQADKSAVMWKSYYLLDWMTIKYTKVTT